MAALVGADAAKTVGRLEMRKMLLDSLSGNAKGFCHADLGQIWLCLEQNGKLFACFLATFSDNLFLTTFSYKAALVKTLRFAADADQKASALELIRLAKKKIAEEASR